jgi:cytochrome c2
MRGLMRAIRWHFFVALMALSFVGLEVPRTVAHPLQAEPINHPYVFAFDQFYLDSDTESHLLEGGLLLMTELRCAACHAAPASWAEMLAAPSGPDLSGVGSRLAADSLWLMVRSPMFRKRGTQMPTLFSNADGDAVKVEALVAYLQTLRETVAPMPMGDAARGRDLYHQVGCVACHEPAVDMRPPNWPAETEVDRPGNASSPIALADAYDLHSLARFLHDPLAQRAAGRMPSSRLTEQEAADLAAYLHVGRTVEMVPQRALLGVPPQSAELGRQVFSAQRCDACHDTGEALALGKPALPMTQLQTSTATNCLAESPESGAPRFGLNALQRRALSLALKHVQSTEAHAMTAHERIDWTMAKLNCYACHDRGGKGGPEEARAAWFVSDQGSLLPPSLDAVGVRLRHVDLERVLRHAELKPQPSWKAPLRMPWFGDLGVGGLIQEFIEADQP